MLVIILWFLVEGAGQQRELCRQVSSALCAVAELFMTDLCDEPDAEENCQKSFQAAIAADQENPEAWQTKARYLLIREKFDVRKL